jgi:hypothetical protein
MSLAVWYRLQNDGGNLVMDMTTSGGMPNLFDLVEARGVANVAFGRDSGPASDDPNLADLHAVSVCNDEGADDGRVLSLCADELEPGRSQLSVCADEVEPQGPQGLAGFSVCADEVEPQRPQVFADLSVCADELEDRSSG